MKKPLYKRWYFWVIIIFLVIGLGGGTSSKKTTEEPKPTEEIVETISDEESTYLSLEETLDLLKSTETFSDKEGFEVNLYLKDDTFFFELSQEGLAEAIIASPADGKEWANTMIESTNSIWTNIKDLTGRDDVNFVLNVLNDQNKENSILYVINDTVIYNAVDELE